MWISGSSCSGRCKSGITTIYDIFNARHHIFVRIMRRQWNCFYKSPWCPSLLQSLYSIATTQSLLLLLLLLLLPPPLLPRRRALGLLQFHTTTLGFSFPCA